MALSFFFIMQCLPLRHASEVTGALWVCQQRSVSLLYLPLIIQINKVFMMHESRILFLGFFLALLQCNDHPWNHVPIAICCK